MEVKRKQRESQSIEEITGNMLMINKDKALLGKSL
jgi:hypothetical protein